jgi:catecholate siderophore receptor
MLLVFSALTPLSPSALAAQADVLYAFDIPSRPLADALASFTGITGWRIASDTTGAAASAESRAVKGRLSARDALSEMLLGTGLGFTQTADAAATLHPQAFALPGITVTGEAQSGYRVDLTRTATKTGTLLRDVPQSVSVVTEKAIADQLMVGMSDVVRYVPGVTMGQGEGNRDQPTIRGNNSTADFFVDGVRDDTEYFRDLYNVERVEVPKGSNAMIFGRAAGGGLINRVTKQASWTRVREIQLQGGAFDHKRGVLDVGGPLTATAAGRVIAMQESSESYRDGFALERYGITPTGTLRLGAATVVRASYELFSDHRTADRGVPSFSGAPLATDPSTFFGDASASWAEVRVHGANATVEHQAGTRFTVRNHTRFADYQKFYQNVFPGAVNAAGTEVSITAYNNRTERRNLFNQTDVTGSLQTGAVKHVWLVGAELGRQRTEAFRNTGYFNGTATSVNVPVSVPSSAGIPVTFRQSATDADAFTTATVVSGYVQDQIELSRHVLAVAGLRVEQFALDYHNNRTDVDLSRDDRLISPRLGLVLKPVAPLSLYGSYSVSYLPSSGNQFTSLTVTTETLEPEKFTSYEVGAKWDVLQRLSLSAAAYQLDRTNTSAPAPVDPTHTIQTGAQRSRGFELSAVGQVTPGWEILSGYHYQDVEITSRTSGALPGQRAARPPPGSGARSRGARRGRPRARRPRRLRPPGGGRRWGPLSEPTLR